MHLTRRLVGRRVDWSRVKVARYSAEGRWLRFGSIVLTLLLFSRKSLQVQSSLNMCILQNRGVGRTYG